MPQLKLPRALTASRSLPAIAPVDVKITAKPAATAHEVLCILASRYCLRKVSPYTSKQATGQIPGGALSGQSGEGQQGK
jgi:hypothetical protein